MAVKQTKKRSITHFNAHLTFAELLISVNRLNQLRNVRDKLGNVMQYKEHDEQSVKAATKCLISKQTHKRKCNDYFLTSENMARQSKRGQQRCSSLSINIPLF